MDLNQTFTYWRTRIAVGLFTILLVGLAGMLAWDWYAEFRTRNWEQVPCKVLDAQITERQRGDELQFAPTVLYTYEYQGKTYRSDQFYHAAFFNGGSYSHRDYATVQELIRPFPRGAITTCYVNPAQPEQVVLRRRIGYTGLVMSIVVPSALIAVYWVRYRKPSSPSRRAPVSSGSSLARQRPATRRVLSAILPGVLLLSMGLGCFIGLDYAAWNAVSRTQAWTPVACTILESRVDSNSTMHGSEHRINVLYSYIVAGREYRSNRYQASDISLHSLRRQLERSRRFVPGQTTICHVNPNAPNEAVLNTHFEWEFGWAFFGMTLMILLGAGAIVTGLATWIAPTSRLAGLFDKEMGEVLFGTGSSSALNEQGGLTFRSSQGAPRRLAGLLFGVLICAGIISVVIWNKWLDWRAGVTQLGVLDLLIVFIAGSGAIWCAQQFRLGQAPQPRVTIFPPEVPTGGTLNIEWQFSGNVDRLSDVQLALEGREELEVQTTQLSPNGPIQKKQVCRSRFAQIPLAAGAQGKSIEWGSARVTVPAGSMHSFEGAKCRVVWCLTVTGKLSSTTFIAHEFKLAVLPGEGALV